MSISLTLSPTITPKSKWSAFLFRNQIHNIALKILVLILQMVWLTILTPRYYFNPTMVQFPKHTSAMNLSVTKLQITPTDISSFTNVSQSHRTLHSTREPIPRNDFDTPSVVLVTTLLIEWPCDGYMMTEEESDDAGIVYWSYIWTVGHSGVISDL